MFGYINVHRNQLTTEDQEAYQSYYCGLCQQLKDSFGSKAQLFLNYDMTFLILLLTALYEPENEVRNFTCPMHPTKKQRAYINDVTKYAADMNYILTYQNLYDDWLDEKDPAKKALLKSMDKDYSLLKEKYPRQVGKLEECIKKLSELEKKKESNMDILAGLNGEMITEIFVMDENDIWAEELKNLAFYLGKFIYIMDAYDDVEKDKKKGQFNPLVTTGLYGSIEYETVVRQMLTSQMAETARSFERLPIVDHVDILRNIIYSGVWTKYEYKQYKRRCEKENKKNKKRKIL